MESNGLEPLLLCFHSDPNVTVRAKELGAITSLIMHNRDGVTAFQLANGYAIFKDALNTENVKFQRKALNLIHYLVHENEADFGIVAELGFPHIFVHLALSEDADVREAALRGLLDLAQDESVKSDVRLNEDNDKLKQNQQVRIEVISEMCAKDLAAAKEERQLS